MNAFVELLAIFVLCTLVQLVFEDAVRYGDWMRAMGSSLYIVGMVFCVQVWLTTHAYFAKRK